MRSTIYKPLSHFLGSVTLLAVISAPVFAAVNDCDRACLKSTLDQYMNAVVKHDVNAAPLFLGFRQTENSVVVKPGTGTWVSVTGLGKIQRRYMDPVSGQAAYFGVVEEGKETAIVTVRVKIENRRITEAEWYLARKNNPGLNGMTEAGLPSGNFFEPEALANNPPMERVVPKAERVSRDSLIAITNSYFDGITTHDGSIIIAHPGCTRLENGRGMTGGAGGAVPAAALTPGAPPAQAKGGPAPVTDCTSGLTNINVELVAGRRFPVVDEEAQVVLALGVFLRKPGTVTRRNVFSEWFMIDQAKIRSIYSAMFYPTPDVPVPNWPADGSNGNWPLPPSLATPVPPAAR